MRWPHFPVALLLAAVVLCSFAVLTKRHRLQDKAAQAEAAVRRLASRGGDPSAVLAVLRQVKPALDAHDPDKAEALLDHALAMLKQAETALAENGAGLPIESRPEGRSDLYVRPEAVEISGYDGSAMEPFISPDGRFLFFNNDNDPKVNTDLYFAERTGRLCFRYLGELPGVNSPALDAVPSMDAAGHFYFTTLRDYDRTMNSIYTGDFDGKRVSNVRPAPGNISPTTPGSVNMDTSISPDGRTLYISRALIFPGAPAPVKSVLMMATLGNGGFRIDDDSVRIMTNINTGALQYAPSISADGLELYFTRAGRQRTELGALEPTVRIMVATRAAVNDPFGEPLALRALAGFVEAPSIALDKTEMFFHRKAGGKFIICRAARNIHPM